MKWYSLEKHKPCHDYGGIYIVRCETSHSVLHFARWKSYENKWVSSDDDSQVLRYVTHFMIPGPIEFDE